MEHLLSKLLQMRCLQRTYGTRKPIDWVNLIPGELIHPLAMKSFVEAHKNR